MFYGHGYWYLKPKTAANDGSRGRRYSRAGAPEAERWLPCSLGGFDKFPIKTRESNQDLSSFITIRGRPQYSTVMLKSNDLHRS
jgi:hypothetical protein